MEIYGLTECALARVARCSTSPTPPPPPRAHNIHEEKTRAVRGLFQSLSSDERDLHRKSDPKFMHLREVGVFGLLYQGRAPKLEELEDLEKILKEITTNTTEKRIAMLRRSIQHTLWKLFHLGHHGHLVLAHLRVNHMAYPAFELPSAGEGEHDEAWWMEQDEMLARYLKDAERQAIPEDIAPEQLVREMEDALEQILTVQTTEDSQSNKRVTTWLRETTDSLPMKGKRRLDSDISRDNTRSHIGCKRRKKTGCHVEASNTHFEASAEMRHVPTACVKKIGKKMKLSYQEPKFQELVEPVGDRRYYLRSGSTTRQTRKSSYGRALRPPERYGFPSTQGADV